MTDEFDQAAATLLAGLADASTFERIAVGCRGSANPAALAWIAEGLRLDASTTVVDLGAGIGGPAAWLTARYRCGVVILEPASAAVAASRELFDLAAIRAEAGNCPLGDAAMDVALLFGVVSVVTDPRSALGEARRVASRLGLMDYCATGPSAVEAGGSRFVTPDELRSCATTAGWNVEQDIDIDLVAPPSWTEAQRKYEPEETSVDEEAVARAIERGLIAPRLLLAS